MPNDSVKEFLEKIAKIESSDNYDAQHRTMKGGLHKGMSAVGRYGIMPYTVAEMMARKDKYDQSRVDEMPEPEPDSYVGPREEEPVVVMEPGEDQLPPNFSKNFAPGTPEYRTGAMFMADVLRERPAAQDYLARHMAQQLLDQTGGDQDRAAYMWTMGHNMKPGNISPEKLDSSDYVQKFRKLSKQATDIPQLEEAPTKKSFKVLSKSLATRRPLTTPEE